MKTPIRGQEAAVPNYGLGRVTAIGATWIEVKTYCDDVARKYAEHNVFLVKLEFENYEDAARRA